MTELSSKGQVLSHNSSHSLESPFITMNDVRKESRAVMKRLIGVTCVSATFMICELIGGWMAHSLAIMTDAAHLLSDVSGFVISIFSIWIGLLPAKKTSLSYGYSRAEILGALTSVLIIWALTAWLVVEAIDRVITPSPVDGFIMLITSILGLTCNLVMGFFLNSNVCGSVEVETRASKPSGRKTLQKSYSMEVAAMEQKKKADNPNLKAAIIHIMGDTIQSIGVILAAVVIYTYPEAYIADPICTFVFSIIVLCTTVGVAKDCIECIMEAVPKGVDVAKLEEDLKKLPSLVDLHDLHVWALTAGKISLSAHISSDNPTKTLAEANKLFIAYGIRHSTVQVENYEDRNIINCKHLLSNLIHE